MGKPQCGLACKWKRFGISCYPNLQPISLVYRYYLSIGTFCLHPHCSDTKVICSEDRDSRLLVMLPSMYQHKRYRAQIDCNLHQLWLRHHKYLNASMLFPRWSLCKSWFSWKLCVMWYKYRRSSVKSLNFYQIKRRHITEEGNTYLNAPNPLHSQKYGSSSVA